MEPPVIRRERDPNKRAATGLIRFEGLRRRMGSRDLPLVRWTAWLVMAAAIALVIFIVWTLATHDPKPSLFDNDSF